MKALLEAAGLTILSIDDKRITLKHQYEIIIENESLFKLKQDGMVIAPFDQPQEMINFILEDMKLNELD